VDLSVLTLWPFLRFLQRHPSLSINLLLVTDDFVRYLIVYIHRAGCLINTSQTVSPTSHPPHNNGVAGNSIPPNEALASPDDSNSKVRRSPITKEATKDVATEVGLEGRVDLEPGIVRGGRRRNYLKQFLGFLQLLVWPFGCF